MPQHPVIVARPGTLLQGLCAQPCAHHVSSPAERVSRHTTIFASPLLSPVSKRLIWQVPRVLRPRAPLPKVTFGRPGRRTWPRRIFFLSLLNRTPGWFSVSRLSLDPRGFSWNKWCNVSYRKVAEGHQHFSSARTLKRFFWWLSDGSRYVSNGLLLLLLRYSGPACGHVFMVRLVVFEFHFFLTGTLFPTQNFTRFFVNLSNPFFMLFVVYCFVFLFFW